MFRKILFGVLACLFILGASKASFAMPCGSRHSEHGDKMQLAQADMGNMQMNKESAVSATTATESDKKAEEVGNKICPVMGTKIKKGEEVKYEYQGKIYNFCCPMCVDEFKKDPDKYIKKIEEEKQKEAAATTSEKVETETETAEHHHEHGK
ncbi:MAG: YHS domain-containing protein [Candidatus Omnitrophota bacterium]|nr:YHS domain-containing protein [Candidatus Omnitrophota bacterium]